MYVGLPFSSVCPCTRFLSSLPVVHDDDDDDDEGDDDEDGDGDDDDGDDIGGGDNGVDDAHAWTSLSVQLVCVLAFCRYSHWFMIVIVMMMKMVMMLMVVILMMMVLMVDDDPHSWAFLSVPLVHVLIFYHHCW